MDLSSVKTDRLSVNEQPLPLDPEVESEVHDLVHGDAAHEAEEHSLHVSLSFSGLGIATRTLVCAGRREYVFISPPKPG